MSELAAISTTPDRHEQIMDAAMRCFSRRGFHGTTMQDLSAEAGISVGLIYRYFASKEAVVAEMVERHKAKLRLVQEEAERAGSLFEALEILFTTPCGNSEPFLPMFVAELFAEGGRNPLVAGLMRDVIELGLEGVTRLIANTPNAHGSDLSPRALAELIFSVHHGSLMHAAIEREEVTAEARQSYQLNVLRDLWRVLFHQPVP